MASSSNQDALVEMIQFLQAAYPDPIKSTALEYITGLTSTKDGCSLILKTDTLLHALVKLAVEDSNEKTLHACLKIFVNVLAEESDASACDSFLDSSFLSFLIRYVLSREAMHADVASKLLSNLTRSESNCSKVFDAIGNQEGVSFSDFVDAFCVKDYNKYAELSHLGSFLSNMTLLEGARRMLLDKERCSLQRILPCTVQLENKTRRAAAARILRNISFETDYHEWLLGKDVDIATHLLLPLAGPEELSDEDMEQLPLDLQYLPSDKQREPDDTIKELLLEALLQLCCRGIGRNFLKDCGAYIIMREMFNKEENEKIIVTLEKLIQILIGDEPERSMENLKEVEIPLKVKKQLEELDEQSR